ncbi:L-threonylcarbamoyladenylate synthase [Thermoplasma sp.]|uniref:L-threonylcarbamoyladenylate synthase n=1 Tax=Thermoplasma sp. TaxID=1973142 RepID=UPI00127CAFF6|nr:L-threonylcarbamoyladenylate synthase [Thermoplasma sp.]KAA8922759.1 MAG: threonylcarbamoyl-AMP synthase [Thermoplasma sp.]
MTRIIHIDRENYHRDQILEAADVLRSGGIVVFPTETVYGLGALADNADACRKIFVAKGRPSDNPLIVHISSMEQFERYSNPREMYPIDGLRKVWPGPLTVVVKKVDGIPDVVTAGLPTVAVRMPDDIIAHDLIEMAGPIAAPSANISTRPSITDSKDAIRFLDGRVDVIIDAGPTRFGIESTIIDITKRPAELLRPGSYAVEDLEPIFGNIVFGDVARGLGEAKVAITPGMKYRHYSPSTKLILAETRQVFRDIVDAADEDLVVLATEEMAEGSTRSIILGTDRDLYSVAHSLFSSFIALDDMHADLALIHPFEEHGIGFALMNRIRKASYRTVKSKEEFFNVINEIREKVN